MSFANLKRNRGQIDKLVQAAEKVGNSEGGSKSYVDDRIWKPTVDKSNNGYAVIRFLPASEGSELPWNRYWDHGFKGSTGKWYIEKSLTSIGQTDPVGEYNSQLWNTGLESDKDAVRRQKRRLHYVSNVYIVSDPGNPANEGKVFLFQYGKKIFDKIMDVMQPEFEDEDALNPFDFWEGANFKLKIRDVEGYRNYDKSEFASPTPLSDDDEQLEKIYNSLHDLREWTDPKNFKSYDELKAKLMSVLGSTAESGAMTLKQEAKMNDPMPETNFKSAPAPDNNVEAAALVDDDDTMDYFSKLVEED
jgi:hypothetical protein